jgi:hypothetical protein
MSRSRGDPSKRTVIRDWPWHVYTPTPERGFGGMMGPMHAFCSSLNRAGEQGVTAGCHTASTHAPRKPDGCLWCFRREADAIAFKAWCEANGIVVGDEPP